MTDDMSRSPETATTGNGSVLHPRRALVAALLTALVIVALGTAMRAKLNFATEIAPAMDAGYYPMQAWWLLEHGRPMYDDVPLFFIVNAVVGKLISLASGMELGDALLLASRWIDCVVPPLVAVPIMLLAHAWSNGRVAGLLIGAGVSAAAVANASTLRMLGDFQKNSMALVFLACAAWAVHRAANMPATRGVIARFWPLALFSGLCAFTHVGGFGAASVMLGTTAIAWFVLSGRVTPKKLAVGLVGLGLAAALAFAVVAIFAPDRADDLLNAPRRLFAGGGAGGPNGQMGGPFGGPMGGRPDGMGPGGMGPGGPGGPGGPPMGEGADTVLVYAIALLALARAALDRSLAAGDRALGLGLAVCAMLLACPLLSPEYANRLSLMAFVPASLAAVFVLAPLARSPRVRWLGLAGAVATAAFAVLPVARELGDARSEQPRQGPGGGMGGNMGGLVKGPVIADGSDEELIAMRALIGDPERTLVVARHGLQWWAGHFLHTPVRNTVPDDAFTKYDRVLQLVEVGGRGGPRGFGGPGGPGGFAGSDGPPDFGPPDRPQGPPRQRAMETPMGRPRPGNVPRESVDAPRQSVDVPRERVDVPRQSVDVPRERVDVPRQSVDVPRERVDVPRGGAVLFEGTYFRLTEVRKPTAAAKSEGR